MALVRPRLNDYYKLPFTQEEVDFAIPFLDEDIPLYVDPFLLWKSPSQQDQGLHNIIISSFNHLGHLLKIGKKKDAIESLVLMSECREVGLGVARDKHGHKISKKTAEEILALFQTIPQIKSGGFDHIEEIQLYVDQISRDRISDLACSLIKSFLIDFTIDQCESHKIPTRDVSLVDVFDYQKRSFTDEAVKLPINPQDRRPILLVPKRWLRYVPWINYDDYFDHSYSKVIEKSKGKSADRIAVLNYNRRNYGAVQVYVKDKERIQIDCQNDPLFRPIPVISAKRKFEEVQTIPTGKTAKADKHYEDRVSQLMASLMYPYLDFASEQSRTVSGVLIRDLVFYNNRSMDFLKDIYDDYGSRQIVMELKNVLQVEREHVNQLNRYLTEQFGRFGIIITRNPLPKPIFKNTIDLWAGQRRCIIAITDQDLSTMVTLFESKQRLPVEVIKRTYIEFVRACPS